MNYCTTVGQPTLHHIHSKLGKCHITLAIMHSSHLNRIIGKKDSLYFCFLSTKNTVLKEQRKFLCVLKHKTIQYDGHLTIILLSIFIWQRRQGGLWRSRPFPFVSRQSAWLEHAVAKTAVPAGLTPSPSLSDPSEKWSHTLGFEPYP